MRFSSALNNNSNTETTISLRYVENNTLYLYNDAIKLYNSWLMNASWAHVVGQHMV